MIQRIQTIWLLLAAGSLAGQFTLPYLQTPAEDPARALSALSDGALTPADNVGLLGLTVLGAVVALLAIFLFKNRALQTRLALAASGTGVLLLGLVVFSVNMTLSDVPEGGSAQLALGLALPAAFILFSWLAARSIRKDEALVRSMDRLR